MRLFEWQSSCFKKYQESIPDLVNYLSIVWQNRNKYIEQSDDLTEEEQQEQKIQKQRFFDFTFDSRISARNYVGVVQFEDIRIEVIPKIFINDNNSSKWQLNLLYWLNYCSKIKFPFSFASISRLDFDSFLELLVYIFAHYVEQTISNQPYQAYQKISEEMPYLRGHLSFEDYTKNNLVTGKWQNFYCSYEPFIYDNLFNQIIKYVTKRLYLISRNTVNKEKLNEILFLLHDVSDERCIASDCNKIALNPLFQEHQSVLELCRLYLSNEVIGIESENSKNFCFLVPMEYIFEDFIFNFISSKWPKINLQSQSIDYLALNQGAKVFQIRNDIYIPKLLIIDTKYKIRSKDDGLKAGVGQSDLYQMISYAIRRNCTNILLLYPDISSSLKATTDFLILSEMFTTPINIQVSTIDVTFDNIENADILIMERVKLLNVIFK